MENIRIAVLVSGVVNKIEEMNKNNIDHFGMLLKQTNLNYDTFVYTSDKAWFKYKDKKAIEDGMIEGFKIEKLIKENYLYAVANLGKEHVETNIKLMYDNIKGIEYEPEDDNFEKQGQLHHHKFAHKLMKAYYMAKQYEVENNIKYNVFLYSRPDTYFTLKQSFPDMLTCYIKEIHESTNRLIMNIRTNVNMTTHLNLTGNASQKLLIATPESMNVMAKLYYELDNYNHNVYHCKSCDSYTDKYHHKPEINEAKFCHKCNATNLKLVSDIQLEYKIYQHLFTHNIKMLYNNFKLQVYRWV